MNKALVYVEFDYHSEWFKLAIVAWVGFRFRHFCIFAATFYVLQSVVYFVYQVWYILYTTFLENYFLFAYKRPIKDHTTPSQKHIAITVLTVLYSFGKC